MTGEISTREQVAISAFRGQVLVLIPAHNEENNISIAIASLRAQTMRPDDIIVVCDNCTDNTALVAIELNTRVFTTTDNTNRKAGALNQSLNHILPEMQADDCVLVMDADSMIDPCFISTAIAELLNQKLRIGAVGGVFYGEPGFGLIGALQRNEYARYGREIARKKAAAFVLTGTATLIPLHMVKLVSAARGISLPGTAGCFYEPTALTEDHELTLAIKTLGWLATSPKQCRVTTQLMPSWGALWHQRMRWQRGAVENLLAYGMTPVTRPYILKQTAMHLGILAVAMFLSATVLFGFLGLLSAPQGLWWALPAVFIV